MLNYFELVLGGVRDIEYDSPISEELDMDGGAIMTFEDARYIVGVDGRYTPLPRPKES